MSGIQINGALALTDLLERAQERVAAMTPEEREEMWKAQRESFARGMGPCEHGVLDFEDCPDCRAAARTPKVPSS